MLQCLHCQVTILSPEIERDAGDWIVCCSHCGAKNILASATFNLIPLPSLKIVGYRE